MNLQKKGQKSPKIKCSKPFIPDYQNPKDTRGCVNEKSINQKKEV